MQASRRRLVSKSDLSGLGNRGRSGRLQASGTLKKHSATKWALAARSAAACCAAKCRNQHRRGRDWRRAAGVPGAKVPGEGDLPVVDGTGQGARTGLLSHCVVVVAEMAGSSIAIHLPCQHDYVEDE